jgi:hypothetical protein
LRCCAASCRSTTAAKLRFPRPCRAWAEPLSNLDELAKIAWDDDDDDCEGMCGFSSGCYDALTPDDALQLVELMLTDTRSKPRKPVTVPGVLQGVSGLGAATPLQLPPPDSSGGWGRPNADRLLLCLREALLPLRNALANGAKAGTDPAALVGRTTEQFGTLVAVAMCFYECGSSKLADFE